MEGTTGKKVYDLEERTEQFAGNIAIVCNSLPRSISNVEFARQVIRSSGSIGANYIEANEALSAKDFIYRIKICRKEAKESALWIRLLMRTNGQDERKVLEPLHTEAIELKKILSAIAKRSIG
ncbi:MAG: four helix bundle protein [Bacteroidetes bacterium]|nr:four helix bundle protein [Bacteroidota bacterium]